MSGKARSLATGVVNATAVLSDPPSVWTYSALKEIEICPLRHALANATYPDLWNGRGYPGSPHIAALFGDMVHDTLEKIIRALSAAGCVTVSSRDAVDVIRRLGGYSAVATAMMEKRLNALIPNPRVTSQRLEQIRRQLEDRIPDARVEIQARLQRINLVARVKPSSIATTGNMHQEFVRRALGPGTYAEASLFADDLQIRGRLDLLTITSDSAEITDHKTGAPDPSHLDQLGFYGALWQNDQVANYSRIPLGRLTVAYPTNDVTIAPPNDLESAVIAASIRARARAAQEQMQAAIPDARTGPHCARCPVRSICTTYWTSVVPAPSLVSLEAWFDFEGIVGDQNGVKSRWMLEPATGKPAFLLRTAAGVTLTSGDVVRLVGLRSEDDPEVDALVASFTATSELFLVARPVTG
jgi:hypothetical protein